MSNKIIGDIVVRWYRARPPSGLPWREPGVTPFGMLVAEVLLARTGAGRVAPIYTEVMGRWSTPTAMAEADVRELRELIAPLGLVSRADRMIDMAVEYASLYDDGFPPRPQDLERLSGVGRYASRAVFTFCAIRPYALVDGVTRRLYERFFDLPRTTPLETVERMIEEIMLPSDPEDARDFSWGVLALCGDVCRPVRYPACICCPLHQLCC